MIYQTPKAEMAMASNLMTQDDVDTYGDELIDLAKRAAQEAMRPELNALRQELLSKLADVGSDKTRVAPPLPARLITSEDVADHGEWLIDLVKRAAQEAMRPELNALRQKLLSNLAVGSDKTRVASPSPDRLITSEEVANYGEELIDLAKRAAQEAMGPELNALRQELLSKFPPVVSEKSGPKIPVQADPSQHA